MTRFFFLTFSSFGAATGLWMVGVAGAEMTKGGLKFKGRGLAISWQEDSDGRTMDRRITGSPRREEVPWVDLQPFQLHNLDGGNEQ